MKIVATTSLPAVDRPNADRWNAARSRQNTETRNFFGHSMIGKGESYDYSLIISYLLITGPMKVISHSHTSTEYTYQQ